MIPPPPKKINPYVEALTHSAMIFEERVLRRYIGLDEIMRVESS